MADAPREPGGRRDPYKVLQVDPEADQEVIQAAYRRLAQKYHPDVAPGADAAERMAAINAAWAILRDPESRAAWDRERAGAAAAAGRAGARGAARSPASHGETAGGRATGGAAASGPWFGQAPTGAPQPETVSRDWSAGRSSAGGTYDPATMRAPEGLGAAGPPPGNPSGSVLNFGRYAGWSLGEIARRDLEYVEWLDRMPIGRPYRDEIDAILRRAGRRRSAETDEGPRHGLFRRR